MQAPDIPDSENSRLATLNGLKVLDTIAEERFDRVTRLAQRIYGVPIALVSLVDENRQWFKSCIGLEATETPRTISFCGHAILGDETFYISDASKDERFADNPLVTGPPNIRFYAGHPLRAPNGEKMGTLCIIDSEPKILAGEDLLALKDLAAMVEQELATLQMATMDDLTNISNRRGFLALAQHSLNNCRRQATPATLAYFDLNNFKPINDIHGHAEGDRALRIFANQLKTTFRDSDVYARVGGDEFVVLMTNTGHATAEQVLQRFSEQLRQAIKARHRPYTLDYAYGLVEFDQQRHQNVEALLDDADCVMYEHKKSMAL